MNNTDTFMNELQDLIIKKDTLGIMEALDLILLINPNNKANTSLLLYRACIEIDQGNNSEALKNLNKALELNPNNLQASFLRDNLITLQNLEHESI